MSKTNLISHFLYSQFLNSPFVPKVLPYQIYNAPPKSSGTQYLQTLSKSPSSSLPMASSSSSLVISPRKLRSDVYSYSYQEDSNTPLVINVLASLIERSMARTERIIKNCSWALSKSIGTSIFDCREIPDLNIQSYLERISRYTRAGPSVYVVAYVYIDRFCQNNPEFRINSRNVHRLLITTIMVASKYVEDMNYRNSYFARVGGLTTKELNDMEVEFLFMVGFKLHVNVSVFESYFCHLEREVSIGGGYHIERTLRCAEEIRTRHREERGYTQIARVML